MSYLQSSSNAISCNVLELELSCKCNPLVYIMITLNDIQTVYPAYLYQNLALNNYIDNTISYKNNKQMYIYNSNDNEIYKFFIDKYYTKGLSMDYSDIYLLIRENNSSSLISRNENKLKGLASYINRLTTRYILEII